MPRPLARTSAVIGEPALWPTLAIVSSATLYATLPQRFIAGPSAGAFMAIRWIVPALTAVLLGVLGLSLPDGRVVRAFDVETERLHVTRRLLVLGLIGVLSAANAASIALLVHLLINGAHANAPVLLRAAVHIWVVNVLVFGLWYWQLDCGGPLRRSECEPADRDFLFPQQTEPALRESRWQPTFIDYLFVSFTNAAAFSPTDTMPLSRWAKMLMAAQAALSLALAVMVVARAVNILR